METRVLLSIKPEFAEQIFDGTKRYEFRRTLFKEPDIKRVIVYASSPVKKVIGEFHIDEILSLKLDALWSETKDMAGISKKFFQSYFTGKDVGHAIRVKRAIRFPRPKDLSNAYQLNHPPQSFVYIRG